MAQAVSDLCWRLERANAYFSVENPKGSYLWGYDPMKYIFKIACYVDIDQCMYNLVPPHVSAADKTAPKIKKPTRLLTNLPALKKLSLKCDRKHTHYPCMGSVVVNGTRLSVAKCAGRYPSRLCESWASLVAATARTGCP